jgi:hypothetical protein
MVPVGEKDGLVETGEGVIDWVAERGVCVAVVGENKGPASAFAELAAGGAVPSGKGVGN